MQGIERLTAQFLPRAIAGPLCALILLSCTEIEYSTRYFKDINFEPRTYPPKVTDAPELALRSEGFVDIGAILVRGRGARGRAMKEARRRGADMVYLSHYSRAGSRLVSKQEDDREEIVAERDYYYLTYFEAKLFRHEPDLAIDRAVLFALAYPTKVPDAGGHMVTPDVRHHFLVKLFAAGADPNARHDGDPILCKTLTVWYRNLGEHFVGVVRLLVDSGADPYARASTGKCAADLVQEKLAWLKGMTSEEEMELGVRFNRRRSYSEYLAIEEIISLAGKSVSGK